MRKVVVSEFVSLDGVMEDQGWTFHGDGLDTKVLEHVKSETFDSGVVVLTYRPGATG